MSRPSIVIANDHAGYTLKSAIRAAFGDRFDFVDLGCDAVTDKVDYPDQAQKLAQAMQGNTIFHCGILICGSGIGISMAANRQTHIRAALCHSRDSARLARQHNDANVLCLGERLLPTDTALECVEAFVNTSFDGGRHIARVAKLA